MLVVVGSDFGRTPNDNGDDGTDHGSVSSMFVMGSGVPGNGVVGLTYEGHNSISLGPDTLQELPEDAEVGTRISPDHVHRNLRRLLGVEGTDVGRSPDPCASRAARPEARRRSPAALDLAGDRYAASLCEGGCDRARTTLAVLGPGLNALGSACGCPPLCAALALSNASPASLPHFVSKGSPFSTGSSRCSRQPSHHRFTPDHPADCGRRR